MNVGSVRSAGTISSFEHICREPALGIEPPGVLGHARIADEAALLTTPVEADGHETRVGGAA